MIDRPLRLALTTLCLGLLPLAGYAQPMGAQGEDFLYQVQAGDTLEALSQRYTLQASNWPTLQSLNQVSDTYRLMIGKVLRIPLALIPTEPDAALVSYVSGHATADGRSLSAGMALHSGQLESTVAPDHQGVGRFEVRTPVTVTGVRGTKLRVRTRSDGSQHEVLQGKIATQGSGQEQDVRKNQGIAYASSGATLGLQALLPPPVLSAPVRAGGGWRLSLQPIPGADAYRVRVTQDAQGHLQESEQKVTHPTMAVTSRRGGLHYVFVRGISALGIEGQETSLALEFSWGLASSDGTPILDGSGEPVQLGSYQ